MLKQFEYQQYIIEYKRMGQGKNVLFCFHGFGRNADDFDFLTTRYAAKYTLYSFNLFYHGNSYTENGVSITKAELKALFTAFIQQQNIATFGLFGYSLGGKVALCLYEMFAAQIDRLILAAPDGIRISTWYNLVSNNKTASGIYRKYIIPDATWFLQTVNGLRTLRLIPEGLKKFVHHQLSDQKKRQLVYDVWISHKHLTPDMPAVIAAFNRFQTPALLIFGKYDAVIKPSFADFLIKKTKDNVKRVIINRGHKLLDEKLFPYLDEIL